jgi:hypothetical protein
MSNELPVKKKSKTIARVGMPDKADKAPARVYRIVDKVRSVAEQVVLVQNADMTSVETPQKPTSKKTKEKSGKSPFAEVNRNARTESEMLEPEPSLAKAMTPSQELSEAVLKVAHRREREIKQEQKRVENARESKVIEREIDSAFVEVLAVQKEVRSTKNKLNSSDVEILQKNAPECNECN